MTDNHPERPLPVVRRELRIERAVIGLVAHGYIGDTYAAGDVFARLIEDDAVLAEVFPTLLWALQRLPRGVGEPTELRDRLTQLDAIPDEPGGEL